MQLTEKEILLEYVAKTYDDIKRLKLTDEIIIKFKAGNFILVRDMISRELTELKAFVDKR